MRQLPALAFVPVSQVVSAFEQLQDCKYYSDNEPEMRDLLSYFENNWKGVNGCHFPVSFWNVYTAAHQDLPNTNNAVEGGIEVFRR